MISIVGVFKSRSDADNAAAKLRAAGFAQDTINILTPHSSERELESVPQIQGEQPGMARAIGTVAGGAAGFGVGEALATLLVPGVGPVLAIGVAAGTLLGALAGNTLGGVAENKIFPGLPEDELYVYEDALRRGRTVLVAMATDKKDAESARTIIESAGAESIDEARDKWWLGLRDVEKEKYEAQGGSFQENEQPFRRGFEAGLRNPGRSYEEARTDLSWTYPDVWQSEAFRAGYRRAQASRNASEAKARTTASR
jgi:hypothetical protein